MNKFSVQIMIGLPGSGKTTHAKKLNGEYIDADALFKAGDTLDDVIDYCNALMHDIRDNLILDGLFLTKEVQDKLKDSLNGYVRFTYFTPNVSACVYNDRLRNRELSSEAVIRNSSVHRPNSPSNTITVYKFDYLHELICEMELNDVLEGDQWSTGGTYGTCWDEDGPSECSIDPEERIEDVHHYQQVLKYFFEANWRDYIDTYAPWFQRESSGESDYYGGYQTHENWSADTRSVLRAILYDLHDMECFDTVVVHETHPELFV